MFEREQLRAKLLEGRVEEIKLRRRSITKKEPEIEKMPSTTEVDRVWNPYGADEYLQIISADTEFREAVNTFNEIVRDVIKKRQLQVRIMEKTSFEENLESDTDDQSAQ